MSAAYSPTPQDIERYRKLRLLCSELGERMIPTVPSKAFEDIGNALGIRQNGVIVFDTEDMSAVLMDCCLFDWYQDGKNVVQKYAEMHPPLPGSDDSRVLEAHVRAQYRLLTAQDRVRGAGVYCKDIFNHEELFLMDIGLSESISGRMGVATRTMPFGEFWITSGAALPVEPGIDFQQALKEVARTFDGPIEESAVASLSIVRACLARGAAQHVRYGEMPKTTGKSRKRPLRWRRR